ncbi:MAG TPA: MFS transporter [Candidatus Dormibacteraeota bacterium]|nr:MFS transporter [Candidatus Dormibacteraeota bacterium]
MAPSRVGHLNREFLKFWLGQSVSLLGNQFTQLALPLAAAVTLHATPIEMGLLGAMRFLPGIVVGFPAGVWLDRTKRKPIVVASQAVSACALATIPAAALLHVLSIGQLYAVALVTGASTTTQVISITSLLPTLVGRDRLVQANTRMQSSFTVASLVGPGLAGATVQLLTAPIAIAVDAVSFVVGSLTAAWTRVDEILPTHPAKARPVADAIEGQRWMWRQPLVRAVSLTILLNNGGNNVVFAVYVLYFVTQVGITPAQLGLVFAVAGTTALLGARIARPLVARGWLGPLMAVGAGLVVVGQSGTLVGAYAPHRAVLPILLAFSALLGCALMVYNVNQQSIRQAVTPNLLLARVQSGVFVLVSIAAVLGSLLGGAIGQSFGLRAAITVGVAIELVSAVPSIFSPLRKLREVPATAVP